MIVGELNDEQSLPCTTMSEVSTLQWDHRSVYVVIVITVELRIDAGPRIQARGSDSCVLIEAGPQLQAGVGYRYPHTG